MAKNRASQQKRDREFKKRERERKKREKAELKRERRLGGQDEEGGETAALTDVQEDTTDQLPDSKDE